MAPLRKYRIVPVEGVISQADWQALCDRFDRRCVQCGKSEPEIKLTADHVVPVAQGGTHTIENLQPLCGRCNSRKGSHVLDFRDRPFLNELKSRELPKMPGKRGGPRTPGPGKRLGPEPKPIAEKTRIYRKVRVMLDPEQEMVIPVDAETRALAQRLMLNDWPGVERVDQLFAYALVKLAETADDE